MVAVLGAAWRIPVKRSYTGPRPVSSHEVAAKICLLRPDDRVIVVAE